MSINQYEWLLAIARMWRTSEHGDDEPAIPVMERIDGMLGQLAPSGRQPSNESTFLRSRHGAGAAVFDSGMPGLGDPSRARLSVAALPRGMVFCYMAKCPKFVGVRSMVAGPLAAYRCLSRILPLAPHLGFALIRSKTASGERCTGPWC